ncbi:hypothetical protein B0H17DRAFT_1142564 [Mycena rosella]|uniref:Uncharacterized protein n=1 Tax=Mycena rosella TaxID=1033263 RepID=A0AAD7CXI9_MYCRO|nr:hypothetical protein B0H17DRAFT_1142564 [Mycena rosella]
MRTGNRFGICHQHKRGASGTAGGCCGEVFEEIQAQGVRGAGSCGGAGSSKADKVHAASIPLPANSYWRCRDETDPELGEFKDSHERLLAVFLHIRIAELCSRKRWLPAGLCQVALVFDIVASVRQQEQLECGGWRCPRLTQVWVFGKWVNLGRCESGAAGCLTRDYGRGINSNYESVRGGGGRCSD